MVTPAPARERVVGSVLGLALGDALGAPFEFRRARAIPDPVPAFELPWGALPPGSTTDDTAMARNLVRSLAARGGLDADDLVARHLAWFAGDPPDVGNLTRRDWEERGPEVSAGNGSVMYCAPLGLAYAARPRAELRDAADALSGLTHHDPRCRMAVAAVASVAADLACGAAAADAVADALAVAEPLPGGEELAFLVEAIGATRAIDGPDQGFCLYAAGVGLQSVLRDGDVEGGLRRVVGLGGDADTNAAVAGALLGARDGRAGLPDAWLARLVEREAIEAEARELARSAGAV